MTPWEIIEEALGRRKPPKKPQWLADQLGVTAQVMTNWKKRQVPANRLRSIADALGLTIDQLEGLAPLPWEGASAWPFPEIDQFRFQQLTGPQKAKIQAQVLEMIVDFELGKSSGSRPGDDRRKSA